MENQEKKDLDGGQLDDDADSSSRINQNHVDAEIPAPNDKKRKTSKKKWITGILILVIIIFGITIMYQILPKYRECSNFTTSQSLAWGGGSKNLMGMMCKLSGCEVVDIYYFSAGVTDGGYTEYRCVPDSLVQQAEKESEFESKKRSLMRSSRFSYPGIQMCFIGDPYTRELLDACEEIYVAIEIDGLQPEECFKNYINLQKRDICLHMMSRNIPWLPDGAWKSVYCDEISDIKLQEGCKSISEKYAPTNEEVR